MKTPPYLWIAFSLLLSLIACQSPARARKYFPDTGPPAIHQRALDLTSNAVVLMVALQPGYEDLNLLAKLRLGLGARTFVLYWTNGEATPDDADGASPGLLAAARKEEAFRAAQTLGAQVYYLNLPDPGVVSLRKNLASFWNSDSTLGKLVPMIRSYGPDVIVVGGDFRGDSVRSVRQRALTRLILTGVKQAAEEDQQDTLHAGPWHVQRVVVQAETDAGKPDGSYDQVHPMWKTSYRSIAQEGARQYRTLRYQLPSWLRRGDRRYAQVFPVAGPAPKQLTAGVPMVTPRLKSIAAVVRGAAGKEVRGVRSSSLETVAHAIDSLNIFLSRYGSTMLPGELRVVSSWKNVLEDLRCSLLGVSITFQSSDSLVTQGQLFYLKFTGLSSQTSKTHTKILFPGVMQKRWGVNESGKYQYDFLPPQEYRVITPTALDLNYPGSQFGILRPFARTRFSFLINHQDSLAGRDFVYRGEVLLQSGPRRTFELLTPIVRALDGEPVVYRLQNISRDGFEGTMSLQNPALKTATKKVRLSQKDEVLVDTLFLSFKEPPPAGTSTVTLSLSGMEGTIPVVLRKFDVATDSTARILLFSDIDDGFLAQAMHRIRIPFHRVVDIHTDGIEAANVLVIDRDMLAGRLLAPAEAEALHAWVQRGGHLVIFPQVSCADRGTSLVPWASFEPGPLSAADDSVVVTPGSELLAGPNVITPADWSNWVVSRSMWGFHVPAEYAGDIVVRSAKTQIPLLLSRKEGKGRLTLVALDLPSQITNLHPGAHRLLGNLLRTSGD